MTQTFIQGEYAANRRSQQSFVTADLRFSHVSNDPSSESIPFEWVVTQWLEQLLEHFSVQQLDAISNQELAVYLQAQVSSDEALETMKTSISLNKLVSELKRRVMRLAGVQLDSAFVSMAPNIMDEASMEAVSLWVECRQLQGVRHQGHVYRKVEDFKPCHRLQAYCRAQTLHEQQADYLITRSDHRFAVWVKIDALIKRFG